VKGGTTVRSLAILTLGLAALATADPPEHNWAGELLPPVRLEAGGKPIDTAVGHAAPCVCDFDGDGVNDLLVGQFGEGILWIFKNQGTNGQPKLAAGTKFKDGAKDGTVPTG
jgi:hypothetical protein